MTPQDVYTIADTQHRFLENNHRLTRKNFEHNDEYIAGGMYYLGKVLELLLQCEEVNANES